MLHVWCCRPLEDILFQRAGNACIDTPSAAAPVLKLCSWFVYPPQPLRSPRRLLSKMLGYSTDTPGGMVSLMLVRSICGYMFQLSVAEDAGFVSMFSILWLCTMSPGNAMATTVAVALVVAIRWGTCP